MYRIISKQDGLEGDLYISVVVLAYKRKEFILEAVQSVIDQTLERSKYEIIVVKNFIDDEIDDFLKKNEVLNIYSDEESLGSKVACGIENAHGEVISFLEDDDLFLPFKLKEINEIFQQNKDVFYFRNGIIVTKKVEDVKNRLSDNEKLPSKIKNFRISELSSLRKIYIIQEKYGVWNTSSISIRKDSFIPFLQELHQVNHGLEILLFSFAMLSDKNNITSFQMKPLSIYRVHDSWTGYSVNSDMNERINKNIQVSELGIAAYRNLIKIMSTNYSDKRNSTLMITFSTIAINAWRVQTNLAQSKKCTLAETFYLIKLGIYRKHVEILLSVPLSILSIFSPNYAGKLFRVGLVWKQLSD